ncbi:ferrous iron transport protein B [Sulfobacillus thermosulfidooxidans]|uniref:ferrous iron transport protein B n=1 Tax=Sulfobacillus thermosulfidooxidans TaxID=28034 RepID=UPI0004033F89|nr:ferrous iron transport protein B [Sulfobacillus thermosulfidooxidans]
MPGRTIVLVGNPNVGKSLVFQKLTGRYVEVSNFPGSTVQILEGAYGSDRIIDTPGVYGLSRLSDEEKMTVSALEQADIVLNVVDGTRLSRDLFLTLQLVEASLPVIVAINMMDELEKEGATINTALLEEILGVPVVGISATKGSNFGVLRSLIESKVQPKALEKSWQTPPSWHLTGLQSLLWHEEDEELARQVGQKSETGMREELYIARRMRADDIASRVLTPASSRRQNDLWLDRLLLSPWGGFVAASVVVGAIYYFVGIVVAGTVVDTLEQFTSLLLIPIVKHVIALVVPPQSWPFRLLVGQYGMISAGLIYIVALLLPLVTAFYLLLAILEDTGYLPRLATWLDRWFLRLGLNGRAVIPLVLGFGCVTMATLTTRALETQRERTISTILLAWTIPCSAQMGIIIGLLSGVGAIYALTYAGTIIGLFIVIGTILDKSLPGRPTPLLLDLPRLRLPDWNNVLWKTQTKVLEFLREAWPLFVVGSGLIELGDMTGLLPAFDRLVGPFLQYWLGLPQEATQSFLLGFIRRDFGAAGFYELGLTPHQIVTGAVTLTLFVPCLASTLVILKERGWRDGMLIWIGSIVLALFVGGLMARFGPV